MTHLPLWVWLIVAGELAVAVSYLAAWLLMRWHERRACAALTARWAAERAQMARADYLHECRLLNALQFGCDYGGDHAKRLPDDLPTTTSGRRAATGPDAKSAL